MSQSGHAVDVIAPSAYHILRPGRSDMPGKYFYSLVPMSCREPTGVHIHEYIRVGRALALPESSRSSEGEPIILLSTRLFLFEGEDEAYEAGRIRESFRWDHRSGELEAAACSTWGTIARNC